MGRRQRIEKNLKKEDFIVGSVRKTHACDTIPANRQTFYDPDASSAIRRLPSVARPSAHYKPDSSEARELLRAGPGAPSPATVDQPDPVHPSAASCACSFFTFLPSFFALAFLPFFFSFLAFFFSFRIWRSNLAFAAALAATSAGESVNM